MCRFCVADNHVVNIQNTHIVNNRRVYGTVVAELMCIGGSGGISCARAAEVGGNVRGTGARSRWGCHRGRAHVR